MRNLLTYSTEPEPPSLIVAPKGYRVSVFHENNGAKRIDIHRDDMAHCKSILVIGQIKNLLPTDDGKSICGWVEQWEYRFFIVIDLEPQSKPTPYIPVKGAAA